MSPHGIAFCKSSIALPERMVYNKIVYLFPHKDGAQEINREGRAYYVQKPIFQIHHRIHRHHRGELSDSGAGDVLDGVQLFHRYQKAADGQQRALHLRNHRHLSGIRQHRLLRHGRKIRLPHPRRAGGIRLHRRFGHLRYGAGRNAAGRQLAHIRCARGQRPAPADGHQRRDQQRKPVRAPKSGAISSRSSAGTAATWRG